MASQHRVPDTREKLSLLSTDARFDLACACGTNDTDRRKRGSDDRWLYPVTLPNGGHCVLFKTLLSNSCSNDCRYCPLRANRDVRRCTLSPEETVTAFQHYLRAGKVFGLFLSSGVTGSPDASMERLTDIARRLRHREGFKGYIHLKVIPGASDAAVEEAVALASAVSINIEVPGARYLAQLSNRKDFLADIIRPLKLVSRLTARGERFDRVRQTTQFVVGAADENDREIVNYTSGLYSRLGLDRVYFSAYQRGTGDSALPGERSPATNAELLTREHRLYQADFLLRKYGFAGTDIPFDASGNLRLDVDPKEHWARLHPERFPVNVNSADRVELLRVPGFGPTTVNRILKLRSCGGRIRRMEDVYARGHLARRAAAFVAF
jgi:predicted DNA-binding helix-hairpin-helix protein